MTVEKTLAVAVASKDTSVKHATGGNASRDDGNAARCKRISRRGGATVGKRVITSIAAQGDEPEVQTRGVHACDESE